MSQWKQKAEVTCSTVNLSTVKSCKISCLEGHMVINSLLSQDKTPLVTVYLGRLVCAVRVCAVEVW